MPREINKLSARSVATLKKKGRHSDGGGLYLSVSDDGRRRWIFLFRWQGKLTEMGLGGLRSVTLAKARELAAECRSDLAEKINPKERRDKAHDAAAGVPTFGEFSDSYIATMEGDWRNAKHRYQWRQTLTQYAAPLRPKLVDAVSTEDILRVLTPIWQIKQETASRLRGRIEKILDAARAKGLIPPNTANPARWRGHLDKLLPKRRKLTRGHHPAMAYANVPEFVERLRQRQATAARALEFIILTAARSGEALGAEWSEIDFDAKVWTVPAGRMKGEREHRVPLSARAVEILEHMCKTKVSDFVFPGNKPKRPLSNMATDMLLRRMKAGDVTTHGFRSSFRDWAGELTTFPREIAEAALAHAVGDETERAYRRGDALAKRRKLMDAWALYLNRQRSISDNVRPFAKARA